jgi:hypothetical protein
MLCGLRKASPTPLSCFQDWANPLAPPLRAAGWNLESQPCSCLSTRPSAPPKSAAIHSAYLPLPGVAATYVSPSFLPPFQNVLLAVSVALQWPSWSLSRGLLPSGDWDFDILVFHSLLRALQDTIRRTHARADDRDRSPIAIPVCHTVRRERCGDSWQRRALAARSEPARAPPQTRPILGRSYPGGAS